MFCREFGDHCCTCMVRSELEIHCWNWVAYSELTFAAEFCALQRIWGLMSNLYCLQEFEIRCQNWVGCSELTFAAELCVLQRIWGSLPKLYSLQRIWNLLLKLSCLQWINIRCQIVCFALNLGFALGFDAEVVWSVVDSKLSCLQRISIRCRIVCCVENFGFVIEVELSAANL